LNTVSSEILSEAYERLHRTGPEFGGDDWLSNHGPMAAEALVRRGFEASVPAWLDHYVRRLDELPAPTEAVTDENWREALGDMGRVGDWTAYLVREVAERPWRDVLVTWWPRLLPGIVAGATHGVIRVGHAVRALLDSESEGEPAVTELAHGLAYWAARVQYVPGLAEPAGTLEPAAALAAVPRIPAQRGPIRPRLAQLDGLAGWTRAVAALRAPADPDGARALLADLVDTATRRYLTHGHGSSVLLVHAATAPNAVLRTLPALPRELWAPSLGAAWAVSAALTAAYAPDEPAPGDALPAAPAGPDALGAVLERAATHGDEHVIKLADTAADAYERTRDPDTLAAAVRATTLIDPPR
jgi:Questin oxidase-like